MKARLTPTGIEGLDRVVGGFPRGGLIVLAGRPGTGKTMFSARFLYEGVRLGERGVYASFSEDKRSFYGNMKSIGLDFEKLEREGSFKFLDLLSVRKPGVANATELILETAEALGAGRLVVDSFSALAQAFRDKAELRTFTHSILAKIVRDLDCTTILVEEVPVGEERIGYGVEEFVADAVIILRESMFEERPLRDLRIVKLRGVELKERQLIFTLTGGFKVFSPPKLPRLGKWRRVKPPEDPSMEAYSTGIRSLDRLIGGYPKGSTILLEVDPKIENYSYHLTVLMPAAAGFVDKGRAVIIIPSLSVSWRYISRLAEAIGGTKEEVDRFVRVIVVREPVGEKPPFLVQVKGEGIEEDYRVLHQTEEKLIRETGQPTLKLVGVDSLVARYGLEDTIRMVSLETARTADLQALTILVVKQPKLTKYFSPVSHLYLKLAREHGVLLFYGVKPRTELYAVEVDMSKGYPETKLTPIR